MTNSPMGAISRRRKAGSLRAARLDDAIIALCVSFAFISSFSKIGIFDTLNKGIIALLCVVILCVYWNRSQPKWSYVALGITAGLHAIAFAYPVSPKEGIATYFMFAFWVLFSIYLANNRIHIVQAVHRCESFLKGALSLWSVITLVSLVLPMCYKVGWGGARYFTSFTTDSFEIAPVAMCMLAVDIVLYRLNGDKKRALMFAVVPLACVFAAGTRTYLAVVVVEFLLLLRLMVKTKAQYTFIFVLVIFVCVVVAGFTNIGAKFESAIFDTTDTSVFLEVFTNGRSEFWAIDMRAFLESTPFETVFGHGFSYVYDLNQQAIGMRLYAHNDFINILLNFGVSGLVVYLISFLPLALGTRKHAGGFVCALFLLMWLFNAFFNMLYVYVAAVIGMGLIAIALECVSDEVSQS